MTRSRKTPKRNRVDAERGRLVAALLAGAWRDASPPPNLSEAELSEIAPLLCQTGSAGLGWWKVRRQEESGKRQAGSGEAKAPTPYPRPLTAYRLLHDAYRQFRLSALVHEQEIKRVLSLLRGAGIEPVIVKGWAIARHYADRGLRPYGDIDLCVRPDQFAAAERALSSLESLDGHYVDLHKGFAKLELEAHSSLSAGRGWDELFERSQLVSLGSPCLGRESPARDVNHRGAEDPEEIKVRVLCDEDHLRMLCLHLLRSGAWRPLWLCDVAVALETRQPNFDWDRCLTREQRIAEWVACTIGLARELLGAESRGQRSEVRGQRSEVRGLPQDTLRPTPYPLDVLPRWLAPAVLRQWGRSLNPHALEMALPALASRKRDARGFFQEAYARWDQPVRATVAMRGRFNNGPRWPFQLGELLLRSSEVPKQMALIVRQSSRPRASDSSAQGKAVARGFSQTIPHPERV